MSEFDVCIVGAGPVGLTLAFDLAKRGIGVALVDKELQAGPWPKMERCNARSMEIYRRLGLHEEIRRQFGQADRLDVLDFKGALEGRPCHPGGGSAGQLDVHDTGVAGPGAF